jgi:hypothetical protein
VHLRSHHRATSGKPARSCHAPIAVPCTAYAYSYLHLHTYIYTSTRTLTYTYIHLHSLAECPNCYVHTAAVQAGHKAPLVALALTASSLLAPGPSSTVHLLASPISSHP